jgi:hypothetical protein
MKTVKTVIRHYYLPTLDSSLYFIAVENHGFHGFHGFAGGCRRRRPDGQKELMPFDINISSATLTAKKNCRRAGNTYTRQAPSILVLVPL